MIVTYIVSDNFIVSLFELSFKIGILEYVSLNKLNCIIIVIMLLHCEVWGITPDLIHIFFHLSRLLQRRFSFLKVSNSIEPLNPLLIRAASCSSLHQALRELLLM